ncbi:hypothetical protein FB45DRAFT_36731 [Roridomyces roridus]|uniref:HNH nuclease domain-containing protein n=1 Tax=Roridomyces roridus TaxID=1738132 RepID=A0AAD7BRC1_9AGAR|nr:hypothetical protein FB45DRAFT_36731 [Roridomyces roridus]
MATPVPPGYIRLILTPQDDSFFLEIPTTVTTRNCRKALKYLRFLGFVILAVLGTIHPSRTDPEVDYEHDIVDGSTYYYTYPSTAGLPAPGAVYPDILRRSVLGSAIGTVTSHRLNDFTKDVKKRDKRCIFSNNEIDASDADHIIDFHVGDAWIKHIFDARYNDDEDDDDYDPNETPLNVVDAVQNGFTLSAMIHRYWSMNSLGIIKTPNPALDMADMHEAAAPIFDLEPGYKYPTECRYTLQTLDETMTAIKAEKLFGGFNVDAAFPLHTNHKSRPSGILLHYSYAVLAIRRWGKGQVFLSPDHRPNMTRPPVPVPAKLGPDRHLRSAAQLRETSERRASRQGTGHVDGGAVDDGDAMGGPEDEDAFGEDSQVDFAQQLVLHLWSQSPSAEQRRAEDAAQREAAIRERTEDIHRWRSTMVAHVTSPEIMGV